MAALTRLFTAWPLAALWAWLAAWIVYSVTLTCGLASGPALVLGSVASAGLGWLHEQRWRRLIVALGFPASVLALDWRAGQGVVGGLLWLVGYNEATSTQAPEVITRLMWAAIVPGIIFTAGALFAACRFKMDAAQVHEIHRQLDSRRKAKEAGVRSVEVSVSGPGSGRESAVRALATAGFEVRQIQDRTPIPHNGCRPPKKRRV